MGRKEKVKWLYSREIYKSSVLQYSLQLKQYFVNASGIYLWRFRGGWWHFLKEIVHKPPETWVHSS